MASALEVIQADDFVEYFLFPVEVLNGEEKESSEQSLRNVFSLINCVAAEYKHDYIWHKDPFQVSPVFEIGSDGLPPHLHGTTFFGDNIEDEWFIVFLLMQLTIDVDGLVVRVTDSDGEFLLIEAADYLPSWADPETCGQRVYLYQGAVHFIPFPESKKPDTEANKIPSVLSAVEIIRKSPEVTKASQPIQDAIHARIKGYPEKIKENLHRTTISIPAEISILLKNNPSLIAPAVRAFCERDPIDKRACRIMANFRPENCVLSSVVLTRCLYAMLCHEKAVPDKRSGWSSPPPNSPTFKMFNLGYKVACGFEILIHRAKTSGNTDNSNISASIEMSDLSQERGWLMYLNTLNKKGYFKGLLEGSKGYTELLENAKEYYLHNSVLPSKSLSEHSPGHEILSQLCTLKFDLEALKISSQNLPPPDDDSWLEITPEEVDSMLKSKYGQASNTTFGKGASTDQSGLATVLGNFLDYMSGVEGAEFPKPGSSKPPSNTSGNAKNIRKVEDYPATTAESGDTENASVDQRLNFDPDGFSCAVQNILDFVIPEDSWDLNSDSNDSDIGSYEDDGEMDLNELKPTGRVRKSDAELKQYMDQMDHELANTTLAESFERKAPKRKKKEEAASTSSQNDDSFDDVEDFQPVDIDLNALKNILESYQSQMGGAGPASNLLGPMGVHLENLTRKPSDNGSK